MKKIEEIMENKPTPVVRFLDGNMLIFRKHLAEMRNFFEYAENMDHTSDLDFVSDYKYLQPTFHIFLSKNQARRPPCNVLHPIRRNCRAKGIPIWSHY